MKSEGDLYRKLIEYSNMDIYPFHMPGHKRNIEKISFENPFKIDITEIDGFDNLHNPEGIIKQEMDKAAEYYGTKRSYFLVNGSTAGNMTAISAVAGYGDKIIIARNSHKSIYNIIGLLRLKVEYIYPTHINDYGISGSYDIEDIREVIKNNRDAKAIVITSPTYEGVVSDIHSIAEIAHKYNIPLIVDSAHGAHFILSDKFPKRAIACGADIVIESLHKTLPSLTQTAILHYNSNIVAKERIEKYLSIYQTSSPSYVLMSSISNCINIMMNSRAEVEKYFQNTDKLTARLSTLKNFKILNRQLDERKIYAFDVSKVVIISTNNNINNNINKNINININNNINKNITGKKLMDLLRDNYNIEMEMAAGNYVVAMTSIFDTEAGMDRLASAMEELDRALNIKSDNGENESEIMDKSESADSIRNISDKTSEVTEEFNDFENVYAIRNIKICEIFEADNYKKSNEKISDEFVYLYPPGIPLIVPGEVADAEMLNDIEKYKKLGYKVIVEK
ncbi:MAG: aminotransferase class I/II-fold pyridoxal phosphate-dependent enzyme [Lachnospiraceae bacterium]|nr:aminotransferase class I/II-fold pyridoxal phosphate-dependent enzyme [Lachnospiraceae bacterium]